MKILFLIWVALAILTLIAMEARKPKEIPALPVSVPIYISGSDNVGFTGHASPPPGAEIIEVVQPNGTFFGVKVGNFTYAPYALYDTRQGAIDCAWLCYRPAGEAKP